MFKFLRGRGDGSAAREGRTMTRPDNEVGMVPLLLGLTAVLFIAALAAAARPAQATFPGANGKIAFSTDQGDNPQVFAVNPDGSGETQLTQSSDGHASAPDWSPDGTKIAFAGDVTGTQQLYEMNADGSGRHLLLDDPGYDDFNPKFSPAGDKIAFIRCPVPTCAIYVVNVDGSGLTELTSTIWDSFDPQWSPDGSKIAFTSNQDGLLSAVWVMNADGSNQQRLTAPALEAFYPDWSPDGAHIIFGDRCCLFGTNIWVMNADGTGLRQLTHFPTKHQGGFAAYSPDGTKIVLIADLKYRDNCCNDLYTMAANGTHLTRIVADQPTVFFSDWGTSS
jgi:TolB protein